MLSYQEIERHLNRPPSRLQKRINTIRTTSCEQIAYLKKAYPIQRWVEDRASVIGSCTVSLNRPYLTTSIHGASVEDVIEHLAGPIHRQFNCFWRMSLDGSVDLQSVYMITLPDSNFKLSFTIYIYDSADCKVIPHTRKVWREETFFEMDCQPGQAFGG